MKEKKDVRFPEVHIGGNGFHFELTTFIRKEHEGVWYLWKIVESAVLNSGTGISDVWHRFVQSVYLCQTLGIVQPGLKLRDGSGKEFDSFEVDENQQSEQDRLKELFDVKRISEL